MLRSEEHIIWPATEYYLAMKRNEVMMHAKTWVHLENIMLHKRNQKLTVTGCDSNVQTFKSIKTEINSVLSGCVRLKQERNGK